MTIPSTAGRSSRRVTTCAPASLARRASSPLATTLTEVFRDSRSRRMNLPHLPHPTRPMFMRSRRCSSKFGVERAKPRLDVGKRPGVQIPFAELWILARPFQSQPGIGPVTGQFVIRIEIGVDAINVERRLMAVESMHYAGRYPQRRHLV